jgi:beta-glucosidase
MDYEIYPQALESCIRKVYQELQIPIMVTENGIAVDDDQKRVEFIEKATDGVLSCLKDGIPVKGYLYWSLMDNLILKCQTQEILKLIFMDNGIYIFYSITVE